MRILETCISPELIHLYDLKDKTVVIVDIFRASSTMVTALSSGVESIMPVEDLEICRSFKNKGWLIAGERNGKKADGFDLGNSPLSYLNGKYQGCKIAMTTTNGTKAIVPAKAAANEVLIGSFLNLSAAAEYIKSRENDVLILCAGWKGKYNIEDALFAGALSLGLNFHHDCDATLAMETLYQTAENNLLSFLKKASHAKRLQNHQLEKDIDFCLARDQFDTLVKLYGDQLKLTSTDIQKSGTNLPKFP
ncbi:MAG: 2-phosphosulfolactate phosphatase, partial [Cyclobacteriaceae bacterium]